MERRRERQMLVIEKGQSGMSFEDASTARYFASVPQTWAPPSPLGLSTALLSKGTSAATRKLQSERINPKGLSHLGTSEGTEATMEDALCYVR